MAWAEASSHGPSLRLEEIRFWSPGPIEGLRVSLFACRTVHSVVLVLRLKLFRLRLLLLLLHINPMRPMTMQQASSHRRGLGQARAGTSPRMVDFICMNLHPQTEKHVGASSIKSDSNHNHHEIRELCRQPGG